jgi:creatinine amidohydrolase
MGARKSVHRLRDMTWEEAKADLDRGAWALLPCGATEAHGPHLPLSTDVIISEHAAERAAGELSLEDVRAIVLPPIAYAVTEYASEFAGTLSIPAEASTALVREVVLGASRAGFLGVVLCNAHLEPENIAALRAAVDQARAAGVKVAFPDVTRKPHALELGDEFKSGACHAGSYETSLVMAASPFLVQEDLARGLPPNPVSLSVAIKEGKKTFLEAGGPRAYFGDPAAATASEGDELYAALARIFTGAVRALIAEAG